MGTMGSFENKGVNDDDLSDMQQTDQLYTLNNSLNDGLFDMQQWNTIQSEELISPPGAASDQLSVVVEGLTKDKASVTAELTEAKALVVLRDGKSGAVCYETDNLAPQKAVKLVAELIEGVASVAIRDGKSGAVCYEAENLKPEEAKKLVRDIIRGNIDLKEGWGQELSKQEWTDVKGGLDRIINNVRELANETTISVVSGIVGGYLATFFAPVPAIGFALGLAIAEKTLQGDYPVSSGILGGELFTLSGPVGAILIPLTVATAAKLLPDKKPHE